MATIRMPRPLSNSPPFPFPGNCRPLPPTHIFPGTSGVLFDGEEAACEDRSSNIGQEMDGWYVLSLQGLAPGF